MSVPSIEYVGSLVELLEARAAARPDHMALAQLDNRTAVAASRSFNALHCRARALGAHFEGKAPKGSRVLLVVSSPVAFAECFFGLLYAGYVPVPAASPLQGPGRERLLGQARDCEASAVILAAAEVAAMGALTADAPSLQWWPRESLPLDTDAPGFKPRMPSPDDVAFLQYTSGSLSQPKGVMVTHRAVLANERMIRTAFGHDESTVFCSWLPLFHDMGLVGGLLQPLYLGISCYVMTPLQFLARPQRWLQAISRYRATTSGAPNFAYDYCVDRITPEQREGLNLRSWRVAFNGAEPVSARTLRRFAQVFAPHGFDERAFYPCYGLAEATLLVAGSVSGRGPLRLIDGVPERLFGSESNPAQGDTELIGSGRCAAGLDIAMVSPDTGQPVAMGEEGEIWVAGESVASHYWSVAQESVSHLQPLDGRPGRYLRTGDLGRIVDGELFVTGRLKDVLIVQGRNVHAIDIEQAAATVGIQPSRWACAAFASDDEPSGATLVVESEARPAEQLAQDAGRLRDAIVRHCGIFVGRIVFLIGQRLPTTTSGKLQRALCRDWLATGRFARMVVDQRQPGDEDSDGLLTPLATVADAEAMVLRLCEQRLGRVLDPDALERSPLELGFDSMDATLLAARLRRFGARVTTVDILSDTSLQALAAALVGQEPASGDETSTGGNLSATAQAIALLAELSPTRTAENVCAAFELPVGTAEADVLRGFDRMVCCAPVLCCPVVRDEDGFHLGEPLPAPRMAVADVDDEGQRRRAIEAEALRPFALASQPLVRGNLFRLPDGRLSVQLVFHHVAVDLNSMAGLIETFVATLVSGGEEALPTHALPCYLDSHVGDAAGHATWWQARLPGVVGCARILGQGAVADGPAGRCIPFNLSASAWEGVQDIAKTLDVTSVAVLLAAFQVTLATFIGESRVVVQVPFLCRPATQLRTVGCFINPLPVVTHIRPSDAFADVARRIAVELRELMQRQTYPVSLAGIKVLREGGRSPLSQYGFTYHRGTRGRSCSERLALRGHDALVRVGPIDVVPLLPDIFDPAADALLMLVADDNSLAGTLEYDLRMLGTPTARAILRHWQGLIEGLATHREALREPARLLDPAGATEASWVLRGEVTAIPAGSVFECIADQAVAWPEHIALRAGASDWTYAELLLRSRRVAAYLSRRHGIGAGAKVALLAPAGPELVALILALWRLGAVYCPVDPQYPAVRREAMLAQLHPALAVSDAIALVKLALAEADDAPVEAALPRPDDPAYTIFTSGSTGRPKGVVVPQRGLVNVMRAQHLLQIEPGSRVLQAAPIGFDASLFEIVLALGHGAVLVFPERSEGVVQGLAAEVRFGRVDHVVMPPSLWMSLEVAQPTITTLVVAGEACPRELVRQWAGRCRLFNAYGPTEASIWTTIQPLDDPHAEPLIGRPIINTALMVVDDALRAVPPGAPGELLIGGAGVALSYLHDVATDRFVRSPLLGGLAYRSGDRVVVRDGGRLAYLGRIDRQVKVHGVRIELGEIEAVLEGMEGISRAAVLAVQLRDDTSPVLVAFAVPQSGVPMLDEGHLRERLAGLLPAVMVPVRIGCLPAFDADANGKTDLQVLHARALALLPGRIRHLALPLSERQRQVAEVVASVLGVQPNSLDLDTELFLLGMNSLNTVRLCAALGAAFNRELSLPWLQRHSTIASLAMAVDQAPLRQALSVRVAPPSPQPLTPAQTELYVEQRLSIRSAYSIPVAFELNGEVDIAALEAVIREIVRRHPALHTLVQEIDGVPMQRFDPDVPMMLVREDLAGQADPMAVARCRIDTLATRPFDFATEPPLRGALYCLAAGRHVLALVGHHAFVDGWSFGLVLRQLGDAYACCRLGGVETLNDSFGAPAQAYFSHLEWQLAPSTLNALDDEAKLLRRSLHNVDWDVPFLADTLEGIDAPKADLPPHELQGQLAPAVVARLQALARDRSIAVFSIVATAWAQVVGRQAGRSDVVVSVAFANRDNPGLQDMVGNLVSIRPLHLDLEPSRSAAHLMHDVHGAIAQGRERAGTPLSAITAGSPRAHGLRSPWLATLIVQVDREFHRLELKGASVFALPWRFGGAKAGLLLEATVEPDALRLSLLADSALFSAARARRILAALVATLEELAAQPDVPLKGLCGMSTDERAELARFNATAQEFPGSRILHHLCEAVADETPDAPAVRGATGSVSYREFDILANRLANRLLALGVRPGEPVAVSCESGLGLVVALHGVMKSGAAYVALDPLAPTARREHAMRDLGVRFVVADRNTHEWPMLGAQVVFAPLHDDGLAQRPRVALADESPAYILYTSGSSGLPKAVVNTHAGITNRICWMQKALPLDSSDVVLQKTTFTFDVSVWEFFWPLATGAVLHTLRPGENLDFAVLHQVMLEAGVTTVHFVPSVLDIFLQSRPVFDLPRLRRVIVSGEVLAPMLRDRFHATLSAQLHNLYGPTEAAIDVTHWECVRGERHKVVPIGRPIANMRIHVLDEQRRPLPIGVPGELCIAGIGVALGYFGRSDLTREHFLSDPFDEGSRMYLSGDIARWTDEGVLEYLGRRDNQIKLRGVRIEPGEIVEALRECAPVRSAVVVMYGSGAAAQLIAYVVPDGLLPTVEAIRAALLRRLPIVMIPQSIVQLETIPLLSNGKLDRHALPAPPMPNDPGEGSARRLPRAGLERELLSIWTSVLGRENLSVEDHFFDVGGNSMQLVLVQSAIRSRLGLQVSAVELLTHPTVESLACALEPAGELMVTDEPAARLAAQQGRRRLQQLHKRGRST